MFDRVAGPVQICVCDEAFIEPPIIDHVVILCTNEVAHDVHGFFEMVLAGISQELRHFDHHKGDVQMRSKHEVQ